MNANVEAVRRLTADRPTRRLNALTDRIDIAKHLMRELSNTDLSTLLDAEELLAVKTLTSTLTVLRAHIATVRDEKRDRDAQAAAAWTERQNEAARLVKEQYPLSTDTLDNKLNVVSIALAVSHARLGFGSPEAEAASITQLLEDAVRADNPTDAIERAFGTLAKDVFTMIQEYVQVGADNIDENLNRLQQRLQEFSIPTIRKTYCDLFVSIPRFLAEAAQVDAE